jgi:histidyl-tRNA synthetase
MAKVTAGLPQGTRDFGPEVVHKRSYILSTIKKVFELYGFQPLETPAMENLETLMGKYGEEGDKLIFKILNNGISDPKNTEKARTAFDQVLTGKNDKNLTERALKYDLTIPFARYVAMNHAQLVMPFKRYQVQPVWRADRPQKGRYREFYQCDADVVGSRSLWNEIEFANLYATVFTQLKIPVGIRINSRKILAALAEKCGGPERLTDITVAIDKLDKIGLEKVSEELRQKQLSEEQIRQIQQYLAISGNNDEVIEKAASLLGETRGAKEGIAELQTILEHANVHSQNATLVIDLTLARGLNYYTGTIFEVNAKNVRMGSIGGGGRYDDLTGLFGVPNIPGVGISFGVDRIYDVMEELNLFPTTVQTGTQVLFLNLGKQESEKSFELLQDLRKRNIRCELYPDEAKMDKQMKYADRKKIPYVVIIGTREMEAGTCVVKNLGSGQQQTISQAELSSFQIN